MGGGHTPAAPTRGCRFPRAKRPAWRGEAPKLRHVQLSTCTNQPGSLPNVGRTTSTPHTRPLATELMGCTALCHQDHDCGPHLPCQEKHSATNHPCQATIHLHVCRQPRTRGWPKNQGPAPCARGCLPTAQPHFQGQNGSTDDQKDCLPPPKASCNRRLLQATRTPITHTKPGDTRAGAAARQPKQLLSPPPHPEPW